VSGDNLMVMMMMKRGDQLFGLGPLHRREITYSLGSVEQQKRTDDCFFNSSSSKGIQELSETSNYSTNACIGRQLEFTDHYIPSAHTLFLRFELNSQTREFRAGVMGLMRIAKLDLTPPSNNFLTLIFPTTTKC
jgi:hypothetical protein